MARIRTIKPDFCSSSDVGALSREARLFFLQLLTEADDDGRLLWIPRRLCGVLYPFDTDVSPERIEGWATECEKRSMVTRYTLDEVTFLAIVNWSKHQKISHATSSKFPPPPERCGGTPESLRKEREKEGEQGTTNPDGLVVASKPATPVCPQSEIVALYHELLPSLARVRDWTPERQSFLRKRWSEKPERQSLDWWREFFGYVSRSDFLMGRAQTRDGHFEADLEWLVRPKNFVKVIEGKYENRKVA